MYGVVGRCGGMVWWSRLDGHWVIGSKERGEREGGCGGEGRECEEEDKDEEEEVVVV